MVSLPSKNLSEQYDVIIIGAALSGSATAIQLKKKDPKLSILIIERSEEFTRRVGESTVEISSYFLGRVLGLTDYLNENHLNKQGLRFWFHNKESKCFDSCSEIGPAYNVRLPSYQVDRSKLDEHLIQEAEKMGVVLLRPAEVKDVQLNETALQRVSLKWNGELHELSAKWIVDASGVARFLARKNSWVVKNEEHPIASIWARYKNVRSWDDPKLGEEFPAFAKRCFGTRSTATNHLIGDGWWSWWIPLKGGDVSVGIVYDERRVTFKNGGTPLEKMREILDTHPLCEPLLKNATVVEGDIHWRKNLPYYSKRIVGNGFAIVGDAAGFIDPFYSPGMDWIAFTTINISNHIAADLKGETTAQCHDALNEKFLLSYDRWFRALYKDKYDYMGDYDLLKIAFLLDLGLYYFGIVSQPYKYGSKGFENPPFTGPYAENAFKLISLYNKRLAAIGRKRRKNGTWGKNNAHHHLPFKSYQFDNSLIPRILFSLGRWLNLELREGWSATQSR